MFPFEHLIHLDKDSKVSVYKQIANSIIHAIRNGVLKKGTHLPSSRDLAKLLNVHRKTIVASYTELNAQEWIEIFPRKYVRVSMNIPEVKPQKWTDNIPKLAFNNDFHFQFKTINDSTICHDVAPRITIDDGHPDVRISPIQELLKTYHQLTTRNHCIKNANHGTVQGTLSLRDEMVTFLAETRGLNIASDNLLITHGAQMSIYIAAYLLFDESSFVIVGKPNYPLANKVFTEAKAHLIEIEMDSEGIDVDEIEKKCKSHKITAVYLVPHHHYPTTVTLTVERRMKLLELSKLYSFVIIEDDYDYDYHYTSSPYLPLASANHAGNIIYIGSFSKMLEPSLRIGFMVASSNFIRQSTALRKLIDGGGDGYMQNALALLIKEGELKRHLNKAKKTYHQRRDYLHNLLKTELENVVEYSLPSGGMAIWIHLKKEYPIKKLQNNSVIQITRVDAERNCFRFGFASMTEKELENAVFLIKKILV